MWKALEIKARFISQVITGDIAARRAESVTSRASVNRFPRDRLAKTSDGDIRCSL
jgi:hypothetical protein